MKLQSLILAAALTFGVSTARPAEQGDALRLSFENPPVAARPMTRWWWPGAAVSREEVIREIGALADAGFGGAEIQPMVANLAGITPSEYAAMHDYPSPTFFSSVAAAAEAAQSRGMSVDYTFGSGWPTGGEAITAALASVELTMARVEIAGPQTRPITLPRPPRTNRIGTMMQQIPGAPRLDAGTQRAVEERGRIVAIVAVRGSSPTTTPYREASPLTGAAWPSVITPGQLTAGSALVLTDRVRPDGTVDWRPPAGIWQLLVFRQYVADIRVLGAVGQGSQLVADHFARAAFDAHAKLVGDPLIPQVKQYIGHGFTSIFLDSLELPADLFWTDRFLEEFKRRRGYDLTPYLPLIVHPGWHAAYSTQRSAPMYEMDDIGPRIRADYRQTVSDLIIENFYQPAVEWAHRHGVTARIQAHGIPGDLLRAYGVADIPETEDMSGARNQHMLRTARSAADIYGRRVVSAESFAMISRPYEFSPENLKRWSDALFAAGVNQIWMHGFAYSFHGDRWPGWYPFATSAFSPGFSSMINEANPQWAVMPTLNRYIARMQAVLQSTQSDVPVAIYTSFVDDLPDDAAGAALGDSLRARGFDYDQINADGILQSRVVNKRLITPGNTSYAALVLRNAIRLRAEVAEQLAKFARDGLRVVFVGSTPEREEGFADAAARDARVRSAVGSIEGKIVAGQEGLADALIHAGVGPNLTFVVGRADFIAKRSGSRRFLFLRSDDEAPKKVSFITDASGGAQLWDAVNGSVQPLEVTRNSSGIRVDLTLPRYGAALIALDTEAPIVERKATSGSADRGELTVGTAGWHLRLQGHGSEGRERRLDFNWPALRDWRNVEELADFAGVGTYATTVELDRSWRRGGRVLLDVGDAYESVIVIVNDRRFEPPLVRPFVVDVTEAVRAGKNRISIQVMNAPHNALVQSQNGQVPHRLPSGLLGPVRLTRGSR